MTAQATRSCIAHQQACMLTTHMVLFVHWYQSFFFVAGKSAERPVLSEENIEHNVQSIKVLLENLLSRESVEHAGSPASLPKPLLLNNLDWFGTMPFLTFLRQVC